MARQASHQSMVMVLISTITFICIYCIIFNLNYFPRYSGTYNTLPVKSSAELRGMSSCLRIPSRSRASRNMSYSDSRQITAEKGTFLPPYPLSQKMTVFGGTCYASRVDPNRKAPGKGGLAAQALNLVHDRAYSIISRVLNAVWISLICRSISVLPAYLEQISRNNHLRAYLYKGRLIPIALDVGVEPGANGGLRCLTVRLPEPSSDDQIGDFSGMEWLACLHQYLYNCTLGTHIRHSTMAFRRASLVSE